MGKREISEIVSQRFEERRRAAEDAAERRKRALYEKIPAVAELDREKSLTATAMLGIVFQNKNDVKKQLETLRRRQTELREKRAELLRQNGFSADYDAPKWQCSTCCDTGFVNGKMCTCMRREMVLEGYKESGMGKLLERQRFDNFDLDRYSNEIPQDKGRSPREIMEENYRHCLKWAQDFSLSSPSLLLVGGTGLGKTHLSTAMAKAAIDKGYGVLYISAPTALARAEKERFIRDEESGEGIVRQMLDADLLVLDDLGAETVTPLAKSLLYTIVNERASVMEKPTIINTNLNADGLKDTYGYAIASRLFGGFKAWRFVGSDLRMN